MNHTFVLPVPPSTNNLYRTVRKANGATFRVRANSYKEWTRDVEALAIAWPTVDIPQTRWHITIDLGSMPHTRDVDNACKAVIDHICEHTGLADQWLDSLFVQRSYRLLEGNCEVVIDIEG